MAASQLDYNATLWVMRGPLVMVCFRVQTVAGGQVTAASVAGFVQPYARTGFDQVLRGKLRQLYGERCDIRVHVDGCAGYQRFRRGLGPDRSRTPQGPEPPQQRSFLG